MCDAPDNVCVWAMPRTGSTYMQQLLARGLWKVYGRNVNNMQEAVSYGGFVPNWMQNSDIPDFSDALEATDHADIGQTYFHWYINESMALRRCKETGNPLDEVLSRAAIIKEGDWKNHVVFKNMRWSHQCRLHQQLDELYDDSILASKQNIHHVVTWRRDTLSALASWMVMRINQQAHGNYGWDGVPLEFRADRAVFRKSYISTHLEFANAMQKLDAGKTVMIETSALDRLDMIEWLDETSLALSTRNIANNTKAANYVNNYLNMETGEIVRPLDMLSDSSRELATSIVQELEAATKWTQLDQHIGFKSYG